MCIRVLKRSGEEYDVRSRWESAPVGGAFDQIVKHFQAKTLSTRLAYEALAQAPVAGGLPPEAQKALLKRLLGRHKNPVLPSAAVEKIADDLADWSLALDDVIPRQEASGPTAGFLEMARCQGPADDAEKPASGPTAGFLEMARWLVLARFVAQRGQDGG